MFDLHLELAVLYYPDSWGAQVERFLQRRLRQRGVMDEIQRRQIKEWKKRNPQKLNEYQKKWELKNREHHLAKRRERRARQKSTRILANTRVVHELDPGACRPG